MNDSNYNFMRLSKHIWNVLLLKTGKRISIGEYLLAGICITIISSVLSYILFYVFNIIGNYSAFSIVSILVNILVFVFSMILLTKRLHDLGKRWTHLFYLLIPIYNLIRIIKVTFSKGTVGANIYGDDPLVNQPKSNKLYWLFRFLGFGLSIMLSLVTPISLPTSLSNQEVSTGSIIETSGNQELVPENIQG